MMNFKYLINKKFDNVISQWEAYQLKTNITSEEALNALLKYMQNNELEVLEAATQIIIVPGYKFRLVNAIVTNFHQPNSTLLLLIAAYAGKKWRKIYDYALNNNFRFLSYGDSSLLFPKS